MFWELTRACMLACKHCRAKAIKNRHPNELTTEECFDLIDQISKLKPLLIITGGDPMMRDDLEDIVDYASQSLRVAVAFSGTKLANEDRLKALKKAGVHRIAISIDGSNAEKHDGFRGVKGSFHDSLNVIKTAKKLGIEFQINTTVTKENIYDLPNIAKLCSELDPALWDVFFLVPVGRAKAELMPNPQEFEDILCWLYDLNEMGLRVKSSAATHFRRIRIMRKKGEMPRVGDLYDWLRENTSIKINKSSEIDAKHKPKVGVTDGRGMLFISHIGDVYPSGFLPIKAGNVREQSVKEIYEKSKIFVDLKDPNNLRGKCGVCEYRFICGGSRARAYALTGDYLQAEPCCIYRPSALVEDKIRQ